MFQALDLGLRARDWINVRGQEAVTAPWCKNGVSAGFPAASLPRWSRPTLVFPIKPLRAQSVSPQRQGRVASQDCTMNPCLPLTPPQLAGPRQAREPSQVKAPRETSLPPGCRGLQVPAWLGWLLFSRLLSPPTLPPPTIATHLPTPPPTPGPELHCTPDLMLRILMKVT